MERTGFVRARPFPRGVLWAEFIGLFIAAPIAMAVLLPAQMMFSVLFLVTALGVVLLHVTEGFHWQELSRNMKAIDWKVVTGFTLITLLIAVSVVFKFVPEAFLFLPREQPVLMLMILVFYPILSALPQEVVFRPLFFRRYGPLLPNTSAAILLNAGVFSLAHLMYWSWIVALMTFAGGVIFAWMYEARRSFAMAVLLHSIAGWIIFTVGLGVFFYSGNVVRPF
ncbi:CPBP family intramembrane glutamic endopeptidase [Actibacterium lipolyticum]|uniref:CAAX amino terminal protease self- immunity n=1 Tax=Actibacterium lipolyticum TaxID=1524263 RepID=A0A238JMB1_9RHOB|nr:CPBP family intramembrane glutamic endopeptidase [Actibacterium lipolyticum]SMX31781.1 CAAX amino terminal protease self- immunity [Actibacterium lipolyticum]